jgi:hypothetical protein
MSHPKAEKKLKGICTGEIFKKVKSKSRYGGWLRKKYDCTFKTKDTNLINCPVCGHALFWSRTGCAFLTLEELAALD